MLNASLRGGQGGPSWFVGGVRLKSERLTVDQKMGNVFGETKYTVPTRPSILFQRTLKIIDPVVYLTFIDFYLLFNLLSSWI